MTAGFLGTFPAGLTTGFQSIGAASENGVGLGFPQAYPAGLTTSLFTIGAAQKAPTFSYTDTFSDSVAAADSMSAISNMIDALIDSVTGADTQSAVLAGLTTFSDSVTGADTQSAVLAVAASITDSVTSDDAMGATMDTAATFSDSVTATDTMIGGIGYFNTISDSITATDSVSGHIAAAATISDSITATDSYIGGIGYYDTISDSVTATDLMQTNPQPNIILTGTLDFGYSFRIPHQISTFLNFGVIIGDDNLVQVNVLTSTGSEVFVASAVITFYAPGTESPAIITKTGIPALGFFQFSLANTDIASLVPGNYPWKAVIVREDATQHTINCGDINLTTGIMKVVERP